MRQPTEKGCAGRATKRSLIAQAQHLHRDRIVAALSRGLLWLRIPTDYLLKLITPASGRAAPSHDLARHLERVP